MRVHLGSDHAGLELKTALVERLRALGHDPVDHGPHDYDPDDDYPPYVLRAANGAVEEPGSVGIVIGGSGNGEAIAANKVPGVRCALAWSTETARLGREHNNANVLSLGARMYDMDTALSLMQVFLETEFSSESRHARRIGMLTAYEQDHALPQLP